VESRVSSCDITLRRHDHDIVTLTQKGELISKRSGFGRVGSSFDIVSFKNDGNKQDEVASRVAASLLQAVGLPELVTHSAEAYESLAIELALNPQRLTDLKAKLDANRLTAPLFNTPLFTKHIELAYQVAHERHLSGLEPEPVHVQH
jgi:hypothetical protein